MAGQKRRNPTGNIGMRSFGSFRPCCGGKRRYESILSRLERTCADAASDLPACALETGAQVEELEPEARVQTLKAGVLVEADNVHWRNRVRTYRELLFRVKGMELCPAEPEAAAGTAASSGC